MTNLSLIHRINYHQLTLNLTSFNILKKPKKNIIKREKTNRLGVVSG